MEEPQSVIQALIKHRHITAHPIALAGDLLEFPGHRFPGGGMTVIELQGVRPAGEVRILAMRQDDFALLGRDPDIVLRLLIEHGRRPGHKVLRVLLDPGMIQPRVIRDIIEHQLLPALRKPLAQATQCRRVSQIRLHLITSNGKTGAADIRLAQIRQGLLEFQAPMRVLA